MTATTGGGGDAESDLKSLTRLAYLLLTDLHRTIAPLSYPPHTCAAACIYLAGYLLCSAAAAAAAAASRQQQQVSDEQKEEEEGLNAGEGGGGGAVWDEEVEQNWASMCESEPEDISGQFPLSLTHFRTKVDVRGPLVRHLANATRPTHLALSATSSSRGFNIDFQ